MATIVAQKVNPEGPPMDWVSIVTGGTGIGIISWILNFWRGSGITEKELSVRLELFKQQYDSSQSFIAQGEREFKSQLRDTIVELRATTLTLAQMQSAQDVTNKMVQSGLESVIRRCETFEHRLVEIGQSQSLQQELVQLLKTAKRGNHREDS